MRKNRDRQLATALVLFFVLLTSTVTAVLTAPAPPSPRRATGMADLAPAADRAQSVLPSGPLLTQPDRLDTTRAHNDPDECAHGEDEPPPQYSLSPDPQVIARLAPITRGADTIAGVVFGPDGQPLPGAIVIAVPERFDLLAGLPVDVTEAMVREVCVWLREHGCTPDDLADRPGLAEARQRWSAAREAVDSAENLEDLAANITRLVPSSAAAAQVLADPALVELIQHEAWSLGGERGYAADDLLLRLGSEAPLAWTRANGNGRYAISFDEAIAAQRLTPRRYVGAQAEVSAEYSWRRPEPCVQLFVAHSAVSLVEFEAAASVRRDDIALPTELERTWRPDEDGSVDLKLAAPAKPTVRVVVRSGVSGFGACIETKLMATNERVEAFDRSRRALLATAKTTTNCAVYGELETSDAYLHVRVVTPWGEFDTLNVPLTGQTMQLVTIDLPAVERATAPHGNLSPTVSVRSSDHQRRYRVAVAQGDRVAVPRPAGAPLLIDGRPLNPVAGDDANQHAQLDGGATVIGYVKRGVNVPYGVDSITLLDGDTGRPRSDLAVECVTWLETASGDRVPDLTAAWRNARSATVVDLRSPLAAHAETPQPVSSGNLNPLPHALRVGFAVSGVPAGRYRIQLALSFVQLPSASNWLPSTATSDAFEVSDRDAFDRASSPVAVTIQRAGRVRIVVVDEQGNSRDDTHAKLYPIWINRPPPMETASRTELDWHHTCAWGLMTLTDHLLQWDGHAHESPRVDPGDYVLVLELEGYQPHVVELGVQPGETCELAVAMDRGATLSGRIVAPVPLDEIGGAVRAVDQEAAKLIAERFDFGMDWRVYPYSVLCTIGRPVRDLLWQPLTVGATTSEFEIKGLTPGQTYEISAWATAVGPSGERNRYVATNVVVAPEDGPIQLTFRVTGE